MGADETAFALFAKWNITQKLHLNLGYSQISHDDTTTFSAGTPIGGITVPMGTTLTLDHETSSLPIAPLTEPSSAKALRAGTLSRMNAIDAGQAYRRV